MAFKNINIVDFLSLEKIISRKPTRAPNPTATGLNSVFPAKKKFFGCKASGLFDFYASGKNIQPVPYLTFT